MNNRAFSFKLDNSTTTASKQANCATIAHVDQQQALQATNILSTKQTRRYHANSGQPVAAATHIKSLLGNRFSSPKLISIFSHIVLTTLVLANLHFNNNIQFTFTSASSSDNNQHLATNRINPSQSSNRSIQGVASGAIAGRNSLAPSRMRFAKLKLARSHTGSSPAASDSSLELPVKRFRSDNDDIAGEASATRGSSFNNHFPSPGQVSSQLKFDSQHLASINSTSTTTTTHNNQTTERSTTSSHQRVTTSATPQDIANNFDPNNNMISNNNLNYDLNNNDSANNSSNNDNNMITDFNANEKQHGDPFPPAIGEPPYWRRNVKSVNGTIDLSQYEQSDVDRLYGDALLVYVKNFNQTLPARRETLTISQKNGTVVQVPVYRSETRRIQSWQPNQ